jgi:hypothetical protein
MKNASDMLLDSIDHKVLKSMISRWEFLLTSVFGAVRSP